MDPLTKDLYDKLNGNMDAVMAISQLPDESAAQERFRIASKEQANWALRKIARIEADIAEVNGVAEAEIARINAWRNEQLAGCDKNKEFFIGLLHEYHDLLLADNPKAKTVKLPYGTLKMRALPPEIERDEEALLEWVKTNKPQFVIVTEKTNWAELKKVLEIKSDGALDPETGEVLPGITVTERPPKFSVEVQEKGAGEK